MKTPVLTFVVMTGALGCAFLNINRSPSEQTIIMERLSVNSLQSSMEERPSILSERRNRRALAKQALRTIQRLLSEPNEPEAERIIEKTIQDALRIMKPSDRGHFLANATNLIAQSDPDQRKKVLVFAMQKWAENDVDAVSAWAASSDEQIAGMAIPEIGRIMAQWTPEEATAWVTRQEKGERQSQTEHSTEIAELKSTAEWNSNQENVREATGVTNIDQMLPPFIAGHIKDALSGDRALLGDSVGGEAASEYGH